MPSSPASESHQQNSHDHQQHLRHGHAHFEDGRQEDYRDPIAYNLKKEEEDVNANDLLDAVGQLSLNEDEEVRYHGKASGLHLLAKAKGSKHGDDQRNEGGIWYVIFLRSNLKCFEYLSYERC